MVFDVEITDLRGFIYATTRTDRAGDGPGGADPDLIQNYRDVEVEIPLSDSRVAKVTFSNEDAIVEALWFDRTVQAQFASSVATVNGNDTAIGDDEDSNFLSEIDVGDVVTVNGQQRTVESVDSATQFTVTSPFTVTNVGTGSVTRTFRVAALGRMLRIFYRGDIVFWGPTLMPRAVPAGIEVSAHDPTLRLKHHYVNFSDPDLIGDETDTEETRPALPLDYTTVRGLLQAAQNLVGQNNYPPLGIVEGTNSADANPATFKLNRGDNVWDRIVEVYESRYGPDVEFEPAEGLGTAGTDDLGGTWPFYCRLNTYAKQGTDRTATVEFTFGVDADDNLADYEWNPSGDVVRNQVSVIEPRTEEEPGIRVFGHDLKAWEDVGIMAAWENPMGGNAGGATEEALQDFANDYVHAQSRPPQFLTLRPRIEDAVAPTAPGYLNPYGVGDRVRVRIEDGYLSVDTTYRITKVTLKQADAANNVQAELEVVPRVTNSGNVTTGAD